jgi:predicted metal-dependent HD superfamily phosphohydrolase
MSTKADNPACTHLNLCAILSRLDRHRHALEHCMCALELIKAGNFCGAETPGLMNDFHDGELPTLRE